MRCAKLRAARFDRQKATQMTKQVVSLKQL